MTKRKLALVVGVLALVTVLGVVTVGAAFAQTGTPPSQSTPSTPTQPNTGKLGRGFGFGFGFRGGNVTTFDAVAKALNLDPTELFNQLHVGKSLSEIVTAQGKTLSDVQAAVDASRAQAMKDKIAQAVTNGRITQDEANWLLQGLDKGYFSGGHAFGFGFGGRGRGMMRGFGNGGTQQPTPSTSSFGSSS